MLRSQSALTCPGGKLNTTLLTSRSQAETTESTEGWWRDGRRGQEQEGGLVTVTSRSRAEQGGTPQRFPLNYIKNVLSFVLFFPVPRETETRDSDIFFRRRIYKSIIGLSGNRIGDLGSAVYTETLDTSVAKVVREKYLEKSN